MNKSLALALALAALAASCGGGDSSPATYTYQGTVSGQNCFSGNTTPPVSEQVSYRVTFDVPVAGAPVTLVDAAGVTWTGTATSPTSFSVTNPAADPRFSIVGTNLTASSVHVDSTTSCVSFRCCTTLTGDLQA
jgi:hypothetical protein